MSSGGRTFETDIVANPLADGDTFEDGDMTVVLNRGYSETTAQLAEEAMAIDSVDKAKVEAAMQIVGEDERRAKIISLLEQDERAKMKAHEESDEGVVPHYYEWVIVCSNMVHQGAIRDGPGAGTPETMVSELMDRLRSMGLEIRGHPSRSMNEYLISVSAYEAHLLFWATKMGLPMRLRSLDTAKKSGRKFAHFAGMVPFKVTKKDQYFVSAFAHCEGSIFNSGERQRIVKYILENGVDGIDLDASADMPSRYKKSGVASMLTTAGSTALGTIESKISDAAGLHGVGSIRVLTEAGSTLTGAADEVTQRLAKSGDGLRADHTQRLWPCIDDYFPLADEQELEWLVHVWADPKLLVQRVSAEANSFLADTDESKKFTGFDASNLTEQPIEDIRNYFGEQIALYFAFVRIYTNQLLWPTLLGVLTMIGHVENNVEGNPIALPYSIYISFWAVSVISTWRNRQQELMFLWGTDTFEATEPERKEFRRAKDEVQLVADEITGMMVLERKHPQKYAMRICASWLTSFAFVVAVMLAVGFAEFVSQFDGAEELGQYARIIGSCCNAGAILILGAVYDKVAVILTEWEMHRRQSDHEDALIKKTFLFQAANNYLNLFFIALLKQGTLLGREVTCTVQTVSCDPDHEDLNDMCSDDGTMTVTSCMSELQLQLLIIFAAKQFLIKIVSIGRPLFKAKAQAKARALEIAINRKSGASSATASAEENRANAKTAAQQQAQDHVNHQFELDTYEGVYMDYNEIAVQFGYATLFAVAFPLAPLLCLVSNLIEQRADGFKLCRAYRRPEFVTRNTIGSWYQVFDVVAVIAVLTNSVLVGFVGSQVSTALNVAVANRETRYVDYRHWISAVAIEHMVLCFRFVLQSVAQKNPDWVRDAKEKLEISIKARMETEDERESHMVEVEQHRAHLHFGEGVNIITKLAHAAAVGAGRTMPRKLRQKLVVMFNQIDASNDGTVTAEELELAAADGSNSIPEEVLQIARADEDGVLTLSEWLTAWETSAEVLRFEIARFKEGGPGNYDGGHLALPVHMSESQRARVPEICEELGLGLAVHGVGSTTTLIVTLDPADAKRLIE